MHKLIDDSKKIKINCPNCNKEIEVKLNQVGSSILCEDCNNTIELIDDGLTDKIAEANESYDELLNTLENF